MGQYPWFRDAAEILYQISRSEPAQQSGLRSIYNHNVDKAANTAKVPPGQMHAALLKRSDLYAAARMQGKSREDAFTIAANGNRPAA